MGVRLAALLWGLAEATVFFIVPDVLLSFLALDRPWRAVRCCFHALAGALAGGLAMYLWGARDPAGAIALLERIPAIGPQMLQRVAREQQGEGTLALLLGPLSGTPYKTYAVLAGQAALPLPAFLLVSIPARLGRFLLVTLLAAGVGRLLQQRLSPGGRRLLLTAFWVRFYTAYFLHMGG